MNKQQEAEALKAYHKTRDAAQVRRVLRQKGWSGTLRVIEDYATRRFTNVKKSQHRQ